VKYYGPNTLVIIKRKSRGSLKLICEKPTVEKATLPLLGSILHLGSLYHCGCPQVWWPRSGATTSWVLGLAVAKGLGHLQQSPPVATHPLAGLGYLCAALSH